MCVIPLLVSAGYKGKHSSKIYKVEMLHIIFIVYHEPSYKNSKNERYILYGLLIVLSEATATAAAENNKSGSTQKPDMILERKTAYTCYFIYFLYLSFKKGICE